MTDPVRHHARARPGAPALVTPTSAWSWAELDARVEATAARIAGPSAPLAVRAETSPGLVVLVLAALRAGRLLAPLSTRWTDAAVGAALGRLGVRSLLSDTEVDGLGTAPLASVLGAPRTGEAEVPRRAVDLAAPFTVVHTSGSTGRPKAVVHSVGNHAWSARGVADALGLGADGRWLLDLPLYHVGGLGVVMRCAVAGAAMALPDGAPTAEAIGRLRPTHASLVATQLRRLLDARAELSGMTAVLLGGSAVPPDLTDRALSENVPVVVSYGMTEMTSTVTATGLPPTPADLGTSGRPLPHRAVRVSDAGEIEVSGPTLAIGHLSAAGVEPLPAWHATGDLGRIDGDGRLVVTGRRDLMFVSGGENVHVEPIEAALLRLDGVTEAAVVAVPDAEFGARPVAFVRAEPFDAGALLAALRGVLPGYAVPVAAHPWTGAEGLKPDRPALAHEAERRAAQSGRRAS